jgi:hypothetical protein
MTEVRPCHVLFGLGRDSLGLQLLSEPGALHELTDARLRHELVSLDQHLPAEQDELDCTRHLGALEEVAVDLRMVRRR